MRALNPVPGVTENIGGPNAPWTSGYFKYLYDANGNPIVSIPLDASYIGTGKLDPNRIASLLSATVLAGVLPTRSLGAISADAATGAGDPVPRINAGSSLINGTKIATNTIAPEALDPTKSLQHLLTILAASGGLASSDYDPIGEVGYKISNTEFKIFLAAALFYGVLKGSVAIGNYTVDDMGNSIVLDLTMPGTGHGDDNTGRSWWGSDNYPDAPTQVDAQGNFYCNYVQGSMSRIDLGCLANSINGIQAIPSGGQFNGTLFLTPLTGGASIYYTTGVYVQGTNTDPANPASTARILYDPVAGIAINTGSGNVIINAVAVKFAIYSDPVQTWVFTNSASQCAAATFNPIPGYYTITGSSLAVAIASGTPGATITYTTDGSIPVPGVNGTVYTVPVLIPRPSTNYNLQAIVSSAGLTPSGVTGGVYTVKKGSGGGGGGGGNQGGGPPP